MLDLQKIQFEQEEWLKDNKIYEKLLEKRGKKFYFLDGPPYANDIPHIGHFKNFVIKDMVIRQKFMQGYSVFFKPGFDTHGLPIEHYVEKKLGLRHKKDILELGVDRFLKLCKESATLNKDHWLQVYKQAGFLYFLKEPYLTYENYYIESAWWTFKRLWEKGLVYKGERPIHYCSRCQTSLAGYEVTDSYEMLKDPSIYVLFKLKEKVRGEEAYMLVWTTTPWTLAANVALAIREDAKYVMVKLSTGINIILAESRLPLLSEIGYAYQLLDVIDGKELIGLSYFPVLDLPIQKKLEELKAQNPRIHTLIASIKMLKERTPSKVLLKKEKKEKSKEESRKGKEGAREKGAEQSEEEQGEGTELYEDFVNLEEGTGVVHTAGGHGKTDYEISKHYGLPAVSPLDDEAKFTEEAGWLQGKYVKDADSEIINWLEKNEKLLFSSYISHKYPLCWRCKTPLIVKLSEQYFLSIKEIKDKMLLEVERVRWLPKFAKERMLNWVANAEDWNISRQRYWGIPMPIWKCTNKQCNEVKVIASMKELLLEAKKAGQKIESLDLHQCGKIKLECDVCGSIMEKEPYVFDVWFDSGIAPWASVGYPYHDNDVFDAIWPVDRINEGQDQIRGWFYSLLFCGVATFGRAPYNSVSMVGWVVDEKGEKMSKSLGNVIYAKEALQKLGADLLRFYILYDASPYTTQAINLENAKKEPLKFFNILYNLLLYYKQLGPAERPVLTTADLWFLSRLNRLVKEYTESLESFELHVALRKLYDFVVNDFSRTYIKLIRDNAENKKTIIRDALKTICKLLCPVSPFFPDWIWQRLKTETDSPSVVLEAWPKPDESRIDDALEKKFEIVQKVIEAVLMLRANFKINLRWPVKNLFVFTDLQDARQAIEQFSELLKKEVNAKEIVLAGLKHVTKDATQVVKDLFVAISKELDEELIAEGFARELVRHIQDARKKLGLVKQNEIAAEIVVEEKFKELLLKHGQIPSIKEKVNAKKLDISTTPSSQAFDFEKEIFIKESPVKLRIKKITHT
jgi:isoleucyl-tRNA synthetase